MDFAGDDVYVLILTCKNDRCIRHNISIDFNGLYIFFLNEPGSLDVYQCNEKSSLASNIIIKQQNVCQKLDISGNGITNVSNVEEAMRIPPSHQGEPLSTN